MHCVKTPSELSVAVPQLVLVFVVCEDCLEWEQELSFRLKRVREVGQFPGSFFLNVVHISKWIGAGSEAMLMR